MEFISRGLMYLDATIVFVGTQGNRLLFFHILIFPISLKEKILRFIVTYRYSGLFFHLIPIPFLKGVFDFRPKKDPSVYFRQ